MAMQLLLVDDEAQILNAMSRFFVARGWVVVCASSVSEVWERLGQSSFDAVVADLRLGNGGDAEGLRVVEMVRKRLPNAVIAVLTAYGTTETEAAARRFGADAFLSKPMSLVDLDRILQQASSNGQVE